MLTNDKYTKWLPVDKPSRASQTRWPNSKWNFFMDISDWLLMKPYAKYCAFMVNEDITVVCAMSRWIPLWPFAVAHSGALPAIDRLPSSLAGRHVKMNIIPKSVRLAHLPSHCSLWRTPANTSAIVWNIHFICPQILEPLTSCNTAEGCVRIANATCHTTSLLLLLLLTTLINKRRIFNATWADHFLRRYYRR